MWWCCGKTSKEAIGCKYQKHESKDDAESENEADDGEKKTKIDRNLRCNCCREFGHAVTNCPRDPNLKTTQVNMYDNELQRVMKIKDFRKLYSDTVLQTTRFLKKSVAIPIKVDDEGKPHEAPVVNHPFMRGVMQFDDYNYN